ncbi:carbon monoxide dehydrogenase subunit G [Thermopolyspora sp. NPDC052614]|uniref:SRPBCC family protein n=1 Tax=Thermopolyspora sp. NPDC052614 TaxID=3155682 RepID=UPI00342B8B10
MKIVGSAVLGIERARLWAALQDPAVLACTIPGCERLEALGGDVYRMTVSAGVASIKGVYEGEVALAEPDEPERFVLRARGQGAPGTVDATVRVRLSEAPGGTRVDYDADAVVGGMIGGVGQRMLGSVARRTAGEFFAAVERHLTEAPAVVVPAQVAPVEAAGAVAVRVERPVAEEAPSAGEAGQPVGQAAEAVADQAAQAAGAAGPRAGQPVAVGQVFERPAAVKAPRQHPPAWTMLTAFGMGAGVALGSAVIGWLLGRSGRKSK